MLWFNSVHFLTLGFNVSQSVSVKCKRGARSVVQDARLGRVSSRSKIITSSDDARSCTSSKPIIIRKNLFSMVPESFVSLIPSAFLGGNKAIWKVICGHPAFGHPFTPKRFFQPQISVIHKVMKFN